jgi:hypothetical protein
MAIDAGTVCVERNCVRFVDHLIMVLVSLLFVVGDVDSDFGMMGSTTGVW